MKPLIRWQRQLAWGWLALVLLAVLYNGKVWLVEHRPLETDILALLPADADDPIVRQAFDSVSESAGQIALVLVGSHDWARARAGGAAFTAVLARHAEMFGSTSLTAMESNNALAPWWENRRSLLTNEDRSALDSMPPKAWAQRAMQDVLSPLAIGRIGTWQDDPFGLFRRWLQARAADSPVRPADGVLRVDDGNMHYVVLPVRLVEPAFALKTQRAVVPVIAEARATALRAGPDVRVQVAGFVFPAAAAAKQANRELSIISWGSIFGIVLITWVTFRSLRPIGLVMVSLAVGTIAAVAVTAWWYPKVHLLTVVFGASLIGVAEDYGMHYLCVSDRRRRGPVIVMHDLLPSLGLAALTTIASFACLAISPFPGLQQIALFATVGLLASWLTVVLWFPAMDGAQVTTVRVVAWCEMLRARWFALANGRGRIVFAVVAAAVCTVGLVQLRPNDDIRLLQNLPDGMLQEQTNVGRILQVPLAAQFFVVRAPSQDELFQREEALRTRLDTLVRHNVLTGYQAISTWVPSSVRQRRDSALVNERLYRPGGALDLLQNKLGEDSAWANAVRGKTSAPAVPLTVSTWLASPVSEPLRYLWLGHIGSDWVSVVALKGVENPQMSRIRKAGSGLPGVIWADKITSISSVLGRYRVRMSWILPTSYVVIWLMLLPRYGRRAIRVLAPSACASVAALAVLGLFGEPLQLFHVLALYLVFGLGVDYAIFLTEQTDSPRGDVTVAVGIAAVTTILSLGLLALSSTPVLRAFGLVTLVGITVSLLIAPLFCTTTDPSPRVIK